MLIAGRYRLHDPIGRGAMGEVWRAFDETLGRTVAVKLLLPHDSDPTATSRFRLEAQTAGRLNHPYVVAVYDFGEYDGRLFLVMELVEGDSLDRRLSTAGPLPVEQVAQIAAQAAAGLAAAHQQGIVHRDIKPANLLLDADGTLKIGDFGIARFVDDPSGALTTTGQIVGTSLYLAPERALGRAAGPASDVYALGCLLYQLLTGRPPFQADTAVAILHQHLDAVPVPPRKSRPELPPAFENFLLGLLAKQPEDRPTAPQIAEWFGGGAWQGRSDPLPEPVPAAVPAPTPAPAPAPFATTYALPSAAVRPSRSRGAGRAARPGGRGLVAHRPMVVATVAGVLVFLAAMLAGMLWFSPGNSSAESPGDGTPSGTSGTSSTDGTGGTGRTDGTSGSVTAPAAATSEAASGTDLSDPPQPSPTPTSPLPTATPTTPALTPTPIAPEDATQGQDGQDGQDKGKDEGEEEPDDEG